MFYVFVKIHYFQIFTLPRLLLTHQFFELCLFKTKVKFSVTFVCSQGKTEFWLFFVVFFLHFLFLLFLDFLPLFVCVCVFLFVRLFVCFFAYFEIAPARGIFCCENLSKETMRLRDLSNVKVWKNVSQMSESVKVFSHRMWTK